MSPTADSSTAWLPRQLLRLAGSGARLLLLEWLLALVLLVEGLALGWFHAGLPRVLLAALLVQWLVVLIGLRCAGLFRVFGPVLYYDLVRGARRTRMIVVRCLYAGLLLVLLGWVYLIWQIDNPYGTDPRRMADFAAWFFYMFMFVQLVVAAVLTPAFTAGAIAEEKDRRTLEFMLATDLRNREIVLSKLASRLATLTLLLLTGLPILSIMQFLGGVDPNLTLAGFAATGLTMASLGGLGIFCSVHIRRPRDAIALAYVTAAAYMLVSGLLQFIVPRSGVATWSLTPDWDTPITVMDLVNWFAAGNLVTALIDLSRTVATGGRLEAVLPGILGKYAIFHGLFAVALPLWATARLRAVTLKETYGKVHRLPLVARLLGRPRVGRRPMIWKEVFAESGLRFNWIGRLITLGLVAASFLPVPFILKDFLDALNAPRQQRYSGPWSDPGFLLGEEMNIWVRTVGSLVAILLLLAVAVRAAGSISGERDRRTLDELLTTPLRASSILFAKWLGSILSVRWAWLWLGLIALLGVVTQGLHPAALLLLPWAWLVYAAVVALVGLWFSVNCRTTLRATVWTLLATIFIGGGHWIISVLIFFLPISVMGRYDTGTRDLVEWLADLEFGQTPPLVLGLLAFWNGDFRNNMGPHDEQLKLIVCSILGIITWTVAAVIFWFVLSIRFAALTNRLHSLRAPVRRVPERRVPRTRPRPRPQRDEILDALPITDGEANGRAEPLDVILIEEDRRDEERTAERG
jgi:ABC-type transport system involved in multi-copper enzyme maturation permease subunit